LNNTIKQIWLHHLPTNIDFYERNPSNMNEKAQAVLRTSRLELIPIGPEHSEFTKKLDMDPIVMKYVGFGRPFTAEEAKQSHTWLMDSAKSVSGLGTWVGIADGAFVGW
jgi:hypothetical protein